MPSLQGKRWCFTLNNYSDEEFSRILEIPSKYLVVGKEVGESGTPHLQGFIIFETNQRFNHVKNLIGTRAHLEVARGTSQQASQYCQKDGNFEERGSLPDNSGKRSDWERYRSWILDLGRCPTRRELVAEFPSLYARYYTRCIEIALLSLPPPVIRSGQLRPGYQERLADSFGRDADPRSIDFIFDAAGNSGKSWFCGWCISQYPERVQILRVGKRDDLAFAVDETKEIFLFDIGRTQMEFLQYSVLEMLKDQMVFSSKYESKMKILPKCPHVVVFCNEEPNYLKLTEDRFKVETI